MRNKRSASFGRKILVGASAAAMMAPAAGALAQDESSSAIDEIVVTVERKIQSLQDFAGTAGVLNTEELKELNLTKMSDLDGALPGLNIANNGGNIEVWIRGIGSSNNTELGNPSAATHMDGVYVPRPSGFGSAFFDIDRVEVNFGPQGTLRGRQSMSGSVDVIPFKPGIGSTDGMLEIGGGTDGVVTSEGVLNYGIDDRSALRFAFASSESDPLYVNKGPSRIDSDVIYRDGPDPSGGAEEQDNFSYRFSYLIEPTDNISLMLTHDNIREDGSGYTGTNFANPLGNGVDPDSIDNPRDVMLRWTDAPDLDVDHEGTKLFADISTDWGDFELTASTRDAVYDYRAATPLTPYYSGVEANLAPETQAVLTNSNGQVVTADGTILNGAQSNAPMDYPVFGNDDFRVNTRPLAEIYDNHSFFNSISNSESEVYEARFISNENSSFGLPLNYTVGVFKFEEDQKSFLGGTDDRARSNYLGFEFNTVTTSESESFYFDGTYDVADNFRVTAGYRNTDESIERYGVNAMNAFALGNCTSAQADSNHFNGVHQQGVNWGGNNWWNSCFNVDNATTRYGTSGFEFSKFGRTIYNPDTNNDGTLTGEERIAFFLDGVAQWGTDDHLQNTLAAGELQGDWWNSGHPNYIGDEALAANPRLGECVDANTERTYNYDWGVINDEGCLYNAALGYNIYTFASAYGAISMQNGRIENDFDDWRVRFEYDINPNWLTYVTASSGHKSGGFNDNISGTTAPVSAGRAGTAPTEFDANTQAPTYDGENVIYYEVGSKSEFDLGSTAVTLNASGFFYDYQDFVVTTLSSIGSILAAEGIDIAGLGDPVSSTGNFQDGSVADITGLNQIVSYSFNAAEAEIFGLHFDTKFDFENGLNLDVSAVFMDTKVSADQEINDSRYEKYDEAGVYIVSEMVDIDGNELPRAPDLQLRANLSRSEDLGDSGRLDWIVSAGYRSDQFMTIYNGRLYNDNSSEERLNEEVDGYWTFDAGLGWSPNHNENLRLEAYVNNLTDEIQPQAIIITQRDNTRFFNRERTAGIRLRTKF